MLIRTLSPLPFLLLLATIVCAQEEPMIKYYQEKEVIKTFYKLSQSTANVNNNYKLSDSKNGDTLVLKIEGSEIIVIKFTFHLESGYCDYQEVAYSCDSCTVKHVDDILNSKNCDWKKTGDNKYLSNYSVQSEMELQKVDVYCTKIIFRYVDKPKKQYKSEYKSLLSS